MMDLTVTTLPADSALRLHSSSLIEDVVKFIDSKQEPDLGGHVPIYLFA